MEVAVMISQFAVRVFPVVAASLSAIALLLLPVSLAQNLTNPWTAAQTIPPADLVKELGNGKSAPIVVFVGFQHLYSAGHIKGSQNHGSGGSAEGLAQIKAWAGALPRSSNLVIYCGCCPMEHCPNVRPASAALREMGFTKVRVLILPTNFEVDWVEKGFPYDKGQ
jgi:thiosulfate/3-mercaptopyruvate sulfurtransferase